MMKTALQVVRATTAMAALTLAGAVQAGTIQQVVVEDKGIVIAITPITVTVPSLDFIIDAPEPIPIPVIVPNEETVFLLESVHLFNVYPFEIEVPQQPDGSVLCSQMIDFFDVFAAGDVNGLCPLPDGTVLLASVFFGPTSGRSYAATVTPISDLANLPTSSANDLMITWDLSSFSDTTGNFYLAQVSIPVNDLAGCPEPSALALLGFGALGFLGYARRWSGKRGQENVSFCRQNQSQTAEVRRE
jgi:hypothetical protein